jgi:transcriptional regulator with XRE-family HTH domain
METYGSWVQALRENAKLDLRTVSLKSGIHFTTINRIEKSQSDTTLLTAIKIAQALGGDPADLYRHLTGADPLLPHPTEDYSPIFPTERDVLLFERLMIERPKTAGEFIADLLNGMIIVPDLSNPYDLAKSVREMQYPSDGNDEQKWLYKSIQPPFYSAVDIHKYLLSYPRHHYGAVISSPLLNYPFGIDIDLIKQAYVQNGILISTDLTYYIAQIHNDFEPEKMTADNETARQFTKVTMIKDKICSQAKISDAKISDILTLDQAFSDQHEILLMAWNAAKEEVRVRTARDEFGAGKLLIILSRFLAVHYDSKTNWLIELRRIGQMG